MNKNHNYEILVEWTGNTGEGTKKYNSYTRDLSIEGKGKYMKIEGSSDPAFLGDKEKYNPEDLFLASLSSCHMLWYLHLCSVNKIVVLEYKDNAKGTMLEDKNGSGRFSNVTLYPEVTIENIEMKELAEKLHQKANEMCFIANSCNFKIDHSPTIKPL
ncbi:OsmC family protein [Flammeovirga kamogawensis]|uniref:OsmC family protein n=1 Tax=Flammeovirga kamogawensis TaxID=373891 RepID=A0ABX8H420_9BACT|nr:OsmC family protein [Flammeovirga kamogawensis]MBB6461733.1 organic hydroperoxide reductase OsmC/OhrA [Flammeovirga kamogawensis]QWG10651.1 OsmC family protein [Flammeovirga kamogawensis]TRX63755.1 OsmC family peroxiredoxin [Flammeovirga kamogawensis]